ncbi:L-valine transporter subunit YgaH [Shimwellia pseudoproteus]|nr:L-valine transporter subunit YgaH [Shimwellia pseudoproteus]
MQTGGDRFLLCYLLLCLGSGLVPSTRPATAGILLETTGIAAVYALPVVICTREVMQDFRRLFPALVGFMVPGGGVYKLRSIIILILLSALRYGLTWTLIPTPNRRY